MAVGATGQDETIKIAVQTKIVGVKESIDRLKDLSRQLTAIDKQLRSGLDSSSLTKQFGDIAKQFEKVTKTVTTGSAESQKSIEKITAQVNKLNAEMAKVQKSKGIGFVGNQEDLKAMKAYKDRLDTVGHAVMAQPKNFGMAIQNIRRFRQDMHDTSKVGIATAASLRAIDGGPPAFMQALNNSQKLKLSLGVVRENLTAVALQFRSQAKDMQWVGRQMAEGITLPIVGLGTMAVRSFMAVQSEMIQLQKVTEFGFGKSKEDADAFYDSLVNGANGIREMSREFGVSRKASTGLFKDVAALGIDSEEGIKNFSRAVSEIGMVGDVDTDTAMQFFRTMNAIFVDGEVDTGGLEKTRDLMAQMSAVADETSLQLKDLAAAFPEVAPVMEKMGFSAGGVAAALAGMYKRGIPATEAAHGLKFALQRLVSPTKDSAELIKKMGFSFFDAGGNVKKADIEVMALAKNLSEMSPEQASKALGELFGLRQTARMQSFFQDVNIGRQELEKLERTGRGASEMTSDYARGLVASGEFAGAALKPMDRYNKALEEIKKDPTTGIKRLKASFDDFKVGLGAAIAPALIRVGEIVMKILDLFNKLPNSIQLSIVGAAVFLAALAPIMIILAQMQHAFVTLGSVALRALPKLAPNFTAGRAIGSIGAGQSTAVQTGNKFTAVHGLKDRFRYALGMPTSAEKAVSAAGGAAKTGSLGPETAATGALTTAKDNLTVASNRLAAAEAREAAAHQGTTTAVANQATATQAASKKAVASQVAATQAASKKNAAAAMTPLQQMQEARRKLEAERRKILAAGGFEPTGFKSGPKFRNKKGFAKDADVEAYVAEQVARQKAAQKVIDNNQRNQDNLRKYNAVRAEKSTASAVAAQRAKDAAAAKKAAAAQAAVASRAAAAQNIQNVRKVLGPTAVSSAPTAVAGASAGQVAMVKAIRAREAARLAQIAQAAQPPVPPVPPAVKTPLIAAGAADKTSAIFKSLWLSASTTFFSPIGDAAGKTTEKLKKMARAAKLSSAGQAVSGGFAATAGAFTKGRKGGLGGDAANLAVMAGYGKFGKIFGNLGVMFGKFTGAVKIGGGPIGKILTLLLRFNKITVILTVVAGAIAFVVMMFKGMKTNWEAVMAKIQPGIDAIKAAFGRLKETFAGVFEKMMGIFGQLGSGAEKGAGAASAFEGIGGIIGSVFEGIASAIDFVGTVIEFIWPFFERTAYIVKNTVGFIAALFKGEWSQAFMFALATVYEWARPVLIAFDIVVKGIAQALSTILGLMSKIPFVGNSIKGAAEAVEAFSDTGIVGMLDDKLRTGLGGVFGPGTTGPAKKEAKKAGGEVGETLGEAINSGAGDAADGESWVKKWTDKVVSVLEKELDKIRKSATDALEKTHEAALKVYDDRIKAIEDQEKAEEKLYKTEEYLSKKRDLLAKRNIDKQNYQNERSIALYEGRYNDVRMLDLKEQSDKRAYSNDLTGIEDSRAKDLLKETRDNLKDLINLEKDAAKERFDIQKKILEAYLDQILEMTPLTVGEMQSAMDRINQVLSNVGAAWPEYAQGAMDVFAEVFRKSNSEIVNEFRKSGEDAVLDWVAGFVSTDALAAIKAELSKSGGGGGGGAGGGGGDGGDGSGAGGGEAPSELSEFDKNQSKYSKANAQAANEEEAAIINVLKAQIALGDTKNKDNALYEKAMKQRIVDLGRETGAFMTAKEAEKALRDNNYMLEDTYNTGVTRMWKENLEERHRDYEKYNFDLASSAYSFQNLQFGAIKKSTEEIKYFKTQEGEHWFEINGKIVNSFGQTAKFLVDKNGNTTSTLIDQNGRLMTTTEESFKSAQEVLDAMTERNIKPGTAAAQLYVNKINELGHAVVTLPNGKTIVIDVDTAKALNKFRALDNFLKRNGGAMMGLSEIEALGRGEDVLGSVTETKVTQFGTFYKDQTGNWVHAGYASGGLVKAQKDGIIANIGEGGFDEYIITTDPKYRASNLGYLSAAASKLGVKMASGAAIKAASGGMFTSRGASGSSAEYASGMGGDVYINVDTFIGEEEWFASMASKYNMKTVPRQRKIEGQQKRVVSSYNDRYRLR
jgi:TP901 family phage tail tape measure protein